MKAIRVAAPMAVAAAVLASIACSTKVRPYECDALGAQTSAAAQQIWDCNREIMVRVVKGKGFTIQEFEGAAAFFERVTGIPADIEVTSVGTVPGKGIREDLRRWDAWVEEHAIQRDPIDGQVKAVEAAGGG
jgi:hypothetical protein